MPLMRKETLIDQVSIDTDSGSAIYRKIFSEMIT